MPQKSNVKSEYMRMLDDLDRLSLIVENLNNRVHALLDAHDEEVARLRNEKLKAEGKLP